METSAPVQQNFWQRRKVRIISAICVLIVLCILLSIALSSQKQSSNPSQKIQTQIPIHLVPRPTSETTRVAGQVLVKFEPGLSQSTLNAELTKYHANIKEVIPGIGTTVLTVLPGEENTVIQGLKNDGVVQYSESNHIQKVQFVPNDTDFVEQWGLANMGQTVGAQKGIVNDDTHVEEAWNVSQGNGVKVAVLDTGIDLSHPDLAGKVVAQKVFVTNSIDDEFGHGTHVAGIIAADTNNGLGVAGVCPDCQLLIGKAMDDSGIGNDATLATAIIWAADNGAKVINLSEGDSQDSQTQDAAINYAWNKGAVIVAAAGNNSSNQMFYPAASPNVISVAAVDNTDTKASFSDYGNWVNVAAPGVGILSTLPTTSFGMQTEEPLHLTYDYLSGTSMAAPMVSGIAALVWASPYGTSNSAVVQRLLSTATKTPGSGSYWSDGVVDAAAAVGASVLSPSSSTLAPSSPVSSTPPATCTTQIVCPTCAEGEMCPNVCYKPISCPITNPSSAPTCIPRPACLDQHPACELAEPVGGWCPQPSLAVSPTEITPPYNCLGSCPSSAPSPSFGASNTPSTPLTSQTPSQPTATTPLPSYSPCSTTIGTQSASTTNNIPNMHTTANKANPQGLLQRLLKLLEDLLKWIMHLLGKNPPSQPAPCPSPTPSNTPLSPSLAQPSVAPSVSPSSNPSSSPVPSITQVISPSSSLTPSTSPSLQPSPSQVVSPSVPLSPSPTVFGTSPSVSPSNSLSPSPLPSATNMPSVTPKPKGSRLQKIMKEIAKMIKQLLKLLQRLFH